MDKLDVSKPLTHADDGAMDFVIEMLQGDATFAVNFDRVQWDNKNNCYVIIEYLLCDEAQFAKGVTPFTSHPNRYFHKNAGKFISLWRIARDLKARLFLVNYAKKGSQFDDQVLLMRVVNVDPDSSSPVQTKNMQMTRAEFSTWFRELNQRGKR
jgi:hypothetical protein